jgi:hypothetical protein
MVELTSKMLELREESDDDSDDEEEMQDNTKED